ncbi:MAG: MerR family transcriptional regulator [Bacteroidales bacterium]|jgi:DNA-binding transcriptional MerR regulator|nr:MerR family transcriptional regulator [Bacteroidales bacterium]
MEKLFYSIGEVAAMLGENTSAVRFWANSFPREIKPRRNAKGDRMFSADDIEAFRQIKFLVKDSGMTLEGAARKMAADRNAVAKKVKTLESLKKIRRELDEVRKSL